MSIPAVAVEQVTMRFGSTVALENLTASIPAGQTTALWGPNGAGKTTLLRCLLGLLPCEGVVRIAGLDVRHNGTAARRMLGYVPQEIRLPAHQTVRETVMFYADLRRVPEARAIERLTEWGLQASIRQHVSGLSGGMKQKLAVVISLLSDPPVLLLDEPTSNLDLSARREFLAMLEALKRSGKTLLFCSHRLGEVWKLADRVLVLERGRLRNDGTPADIRVALSADTELCVTVPAGYMSAATALLSGDGFTVQRNGTQLWVQVPAGRKAEPLQRLVDAKIPIIDFEAEGMR